LIAETLLVLAAALVLDLAVGDPRSSLHPTAWIGRLIGAMKPRMKGGSSKMELLNGSVAAIAIVALVTITTYYFLHVIEAILGAIGLIVVSIIMLKSTIAIKGMESHARSVIDALANRDIATARTRLAKIVGRDTSTLDEQHILSATVESIGESTVDGITSPLFYFAMFGIPGAFAYRAINTLDSMLGYKDSYHENIGWFSAHLDTIANYIPARITALLMVLAARIIGADWKNSLFIMSRDKYNTPSVNGGWAIATIAGALRVRLEKIGYYSLGEGCEDLTVEHCEKAISIMKVTVLLFSVIIALPVIILMSIIW
jgi:adenosylcobinamide-phosphate synthase